MGWQFQIQTGVYSNLDQNSELHSLPYTASIRTAAPDFADSSTPRVN